MSQPPKPNAEYGSHPVDQYYPYYPHYSPVPQGSYQPYQTTASYHYPHQQGPPATHFAPYDRDITGSVRSSNSNTHQMPHINLSLMPLHTSAFLDPVHRVPLPVYATNHHPGSHVQEQYYEQGVDSAQQYWGPVPYQDGSERRPKTRNYERSSYQAYEEEGDGTSVYTTSLRPTAHGDTTGVYSSSLPPAPMVSRSAAPEPVVEELQYYSSAESIANEDLNEPCNEPLPTTADAGSVNEKSDSYSSRNSRSNSGGNETKPVADDPRNEYVEESEDHDEQREQCNQDEQEEKSAERVERNDNQDNQEDRQQYVLKEAKPSSPLTRNSDGMPTYGRLYIRRPSTIRASRKRPKRSVEKLRAGPTPTDQLNMRAMVNDLTIDIDRGPLYNVIIRGRNICPSFQVSIELPEYYHSLLEGQIIMFHYVITPSTKENDEIYAAPKDQRCEFYQHQIIHNPCATGLLTSIGGNNKVQMEFQKLKVSDAALGSDIVITFVASMNVKGQPRIFCMSEPHELAVCSQCEHEEATASKIMWDCISLPSTKHSESIPIPEVLAQFNEKWERHFGHPLSNLTSFTYLCSINHQGTTTVIKVPISQDSTPFGKYMDIERSFPNTPAREAANPVVSAHAPHESMRIPSIREFPPRPNIDNFAEQPMPNAAHNSKYQTQVPTDNLFRPPPPRKYPPNHEHDDEPDPHHRVANRPYRFVEVETHLAFEDPSLLLSGLADISKATNPLPRKEIQHLTFQGFQRIWAVIYAAGKALERDLGLAMLWKGDYIHHFCSKAKAHQILESNPLYNPYTFSLRFSERFPGYLFVAFLNRKKKAKSRKIEISSIRRPKVLGIIKKCPYLKYILPTTGEPMEKTAALGLRFVQVDYDLELDSYKTLD